MRNTQRILVVDAFADRPFAGNPAAVCVLERPAPEEWMRLVAREMNLSETAFLHRLNDDDAYALRWLTPTIEVDLCGHATLASAHVLWTEGHEPADRPLRFRTRSGVLSAVRDGEEIELDFPACPATRSVDLATLAALSEALGVRVRFVGANGMDWLAELDSEAVVRGLVPSFDGLTKLGGRGIIVTSRSDDPEFDFVSRFFAPNAGVNEDPVTGSAHCALAPFWADRLGKTSLVGFQASARGGRVRVRLDGDRVKLGGGAVTMLRGEMMGPPSAG